MRRPVPPSMRHATKVRKQREAREASYRAGTGAARKLAAELGLRVWEPATGNNNSRYDTTTAFDGVPLRQPPPTLARGKWRPIREGGQ